MRFLHFPESSEIICVLKSPHPRQEYFWDTLFQGLHLQRIKFSKESDSLQARDPELPSLSMYFSEAMEKWSGRRRICWFAHFLAWISDNWMYSFPFPKLSKDTHKNVWAKAKADKWCMCPVSSQALAHYTSTLQIHSIFPSEWLQWEGNSCVNTPQQDLWNEERDWGCRTPFIMHTCRRNQILKVRNWHSKDNLGKWLPLLGYSIATMLHIQQVKKLLKEFKFSNNKISELE